MSSKKIELLASDQVRLSAWSKVTGEPHPVDLSETQLVNQATTTTLTSVNGINPTAPTQLSETINGDVTARAAKFSFTVASYGLVSRAWFGFKTSRYGNPANFKPYWPLSSAYDLASDTTVVSFHSDTVIQCTFASGAAMAERALIGVADVAAAHPADQRGTYTVLLRASIDSGTQVRARIRHALGLGTVSYTPIYRNRVPLDTQTGEPGDVDVYELGDVSIPPAGVAANDDLSAFYIALDLERVSGSGNFYGHGLYLVPNEALLKVSFYDQMGSDPLTVWHQADGTLIGYKDVAGVHSNTLQVEQTKWGIPARGEKPYLVAVANNTGNIENGYGAAFDVTYNYIPRWRTLRGSA